MPELHKLTPLLSVLQDKGHQVALVTDGRMSGASGKVPAAIHVCPEALDGGSIAALRDGDLIRLDATTGELSVALAQAQLDQRQSGNPFIVQPTAGMGRELFAQFRRNARTAEEGAVTWL
jgi:phosphogluconate dehydratase